MGIDPDPSSSSMRIQGGMPSLRNAADISASTSPQLLQPSQSSSSRVLAPHQIAHGSGSTPAIRRSHADSRSASGNPFQIELDSHHHGASALFKGQCPHISEMRAEYEGESMAVPGMTPVRYFRDAELDQYLVKAGAEGEALDGTGLPLDTTKGGKAYKAIGTLAPDWKIYVANRATDDQAYRIQHSSFVCGGPVGAGFEIHSVDGRRLVLWPNSGHYRTTAEQMEQVRQAFVAQGITAHIEIRGLVQERLSIF